MAAQFLNLVANRFVGGNGNQEQREHAPSNPPGDWQTVKPVTDQPKDQCGEKQNRTDFAKLLIFGFESIALVVDRLQL